MLLCGDSLVLSIDSVRCFDTKGRCLVGMNHGSLFSARSDGDMSKELALGAEL